MDGAEGAGQQGPTLAQMGEAELIRRLGAFAPPGQFRDDAAVLNLNGGLVVNTDVLVEGVHFSAATTTPADVGWRAAAANLSDLAAMGCSSGLGLTVGLVAPAATPWSWVEGVYQGLSACLGRHGGVLLGGDCSGGRERMLAITALGALARPDAAIHRGDGRPGDLLVCSGSHGLSRLGLALLLGELAGPERQQLDPALQERAIASHQRPQPRFDVVQALHQCQPAGRTWRVGGTDSSDGLATAVAEIARTSGCAALLRRTALPLEPDLAQLPKGEDWCLAGGEDFELVLALEPAWATALLPLLPGASLIGELISAAEPGAVGRLHWQETGEPLPTGTSGFRHFQ
jgi:thiamine-monophosphate kinase